jgi:two-component sensor histidine kinase
MGYDVEITAANIGNVYISSFLNPLIRDIRSAYIDNRTISLTTDIEEVEITSKQSLPVGIIITEFMTNSIKYAFPENGQGKMHLSIHKDQEKTDSLCIEVSDNGTRLPLQCRVPHIVVYLPYPCFTPLLLYEYTHKR